MNENEKKMYVYSYKDLRRTWSQLCRQEGNRGIISFGERFPALDHVNEVSDSGAHFEVHLGAEAAGSSEFPNLSKDRPLKLIHRVSIIAVLCDFGII